MGLKRRNPARTRLLTTPDVLAALAVPVAPVAPGALKEAKPAPEAPKPAPAPRKHTREERHQMIAKVAYGHAERTGFATDPVVNWLLAEREIDSQLATAVS